MQKYGSNAVLDRVLDGMEGRLTNVKWAADTYAARYQRPAGAWNGRGIHRFTHQWLLISLIYPPKPPAENQIRQGCFSGQVRWQADARRPLNDDRSAGTKRPAASASQAQRKTLNRRQDVRPSACCWSCPAAPWHAAFLRRPYRPGRFARAVPQSRQAAPDRRHPPAPV